MSKTLLRYKIKDRRVYLTAGSLIGHDYLDVTIFSNRTDKVLKTYNLPLHLDVKALQCKSYTALVRFAKENEIKENSSSDDETLCSPQSEQSKDCEGDISTQQTHQKITQANERKALLASDKGAISQNILFCDIETSGKGDNAEVCEISLIDFNGNILLNTLVKTTKKLTKRVTKIHFITNRMLSTAPPFEEVFLKFNNLIKDKVVVFYNADFDKRIIKQSANIAFDSNVATFEKLIPPKHAKTFCLMNAYAKFWGKYDARYNNYRWQSLVRACHQQKILTDDVKNHRALGDAIKTMRLYKAIFTTV